MFRSLLVLATLLVAQVYGWSIAEALNNRAKSLDHRKLQDDIDMGGFGETMSKGMSALQEIDTLDTWWKIGLAASAAMFCFGCICTCCYCSIRGKIPNQNEGGQVEMASKK